MAMHLLDAVRGSLATEAVPLHNARRAATLGCACNINRGHPIKQFNGEHMTDLNAVVDPPKLSHESLRLTVGLGG